MSDHDASLEFPGNQPPTGDWQLYGLDKSFPHLDQDGAVGACVLGLATNERETIVALEEARIEAGSQVRYLGHAVARGLAGEKMRVFSYLYHCIEGALWLSEGETHESDVLGRAIDYANRETLNYNQRRLPMLPKARHGMDRLAKSIVANFRSEPRKHFQALLT
jgi:hypothetical protein